MQTRSAKPNGNLEIINKGGQKERQEVREHFAYFAQIVTLLSETQLLHRKS
jgi:hypothetical protein